MIKLLVASVVLILLGYTGVTQFGTSSDSPKATETNTQIDKSSYDINQASDREAQRANVLNQLPENSQPVTP